MKKLSIFVYIPLILSVFFITGCSKKIVENKTQKSSVPQAQNRLQNEESKRKDAINISGKGNAIDIYRLEVAFAINKCWAFSRSILESETLLASATFKIMPDGKITDIKFIEKSGNDEFDESAYKAIKSASPVKPFPDSITKPYIGMGLRFTPDRI